MEGEEMENTMGERIGKLLDALKIKKVRFAQRLNIDQSYVSQLVSGKRNPSDWTVADICREFHVSELWLRTGQGEMFPTLSEDADFIRIITEIQTSDDSFIKAFLRTYWQLDEKEKAVLQKFLNGLQTQAKRAGE